MNAETNHAAELAASLREIADWIEQHPQHFLDGYLVTFNLHNLSREALMDFARGGNQVKKTAFSNSFWLERRFGGLSVSAFAHDREQVCRRVVKGVKKVTIPAQPERIEQREIVEWECEPILAARLTAEDA